MKASVLIALTLAVSLAAPVQYAHAQGSYAGTWTVTEATRPDWLEPTSPGPNTVLNIGDTIVFSDKSVTAVEPIGCENVTYQQVTLKTPDIFQGGILDVAKAASVAQQFGLSSTIPTLRVFCPNGTFDYHKNKDGVVMMFDNMVYTLTQKPVKR